MRKEIKIVEDEMILTAEKQNSSSFVSQVTKSLHEI